MLTSVLHANLGFMYYDMGKVDSAKIEFSKALNKARGLPDRLRYTYNLWYHQIRRDIGYEKLEKLCLQWKTRYPNDLLPYETLDWVYNAQSAYDKRIDVLKDAIGNGFKNEMLIPLAKAYMDGGKYQKAKKSYELYKKEFPSRLESTKDLAIVYNKLGQSEKALEHLDNLISLSPNDLSIGIEKAKLLGCTGAIKEELKTYQTYKNKLLTIEDTISLSNAIFEYYIRLGQLNNAANEQQALQRVTKNKITNLNYIFSDLVGKLNLYDNLKDASQIESLRPLLKKPLIKEVGYDCYIKYIVFRKQENTDSLSYYFENCPILNTAGDAFVLSEQAFLYELRGDYEEALNLYNASLKKDPANNDYKISQAKCLLKVDRFEDALILLQNILTVDKSNPEIFLLTARAFEKINPSQARQNLEIALEMVKDSDLDSKLVHEINKLKTRIL